MCSQPYSQSYSQQGGGGCLASIGDVAGPLASSPIYEAGHALFSGMQCGGHLAAEILGTIPLVVRPSGGGEVTCGQEGLFSHFLRTGSLEVGLLPLSQT